MVEPLTVPGPGAVRPAALDDEPTIAALLSSYLVEMRGKGSEIRPTPLTLSFYLGLFRSYVSGTVDGVVVIAEGGFSMAGDATLPIDSDFGKTAIGWGTYVDPAHRGHRLASELRRELRAGLRALGFQTVLGGVHLDDTTALASVRKTGWVPYLVQGVDDLRRGD